MKQILYDTETTGSNVRFDQILQAAAVVVDDDFKIVETLNERSRLARHVIPHPMALKVTGIKPEDLDRAPYSPYDFSRMILNTFQEWSKGGAAFGGWNSIKFDEEIMRQMFWENLHKPYLTNMNKNTRVDYLAMARALYARNPEAILFPVTEETGRPNFRLENLAPLNGFEDHAAHDALGDVLALVHVGRLIRDTDPDLYNQMHRMGDAREVIDFAEGQVVFRIIGGSFLEPAATSVCLLATESHNAKSKISFNLGYDPQPYLDLDVDEIVSKIKQSGGPFRRIRCNQAPGLFPIGWGFSRLTKETENTSDDVIDARAAMLCADKDFKRRVTSAMDIIAGSYTQSDDLEEKIYSGFPSRADEKRMEEFHSKDSWSDRMEIVRSFEGPTLRSLGVRTIYVNAPQVLPESLRNACDKMIAENRLTLEEDRKWTTLGTFFKAAAELDDPDLRKSCEEWAKDRWGISPEKAKEYRDVKAALDAESAALEEARKKDEAAAQKKEKAEAIKKIEETAKALKKAEKEAAKIAKTEKSVKNIVEEAPQPASRAHFLDGIL